MKKYIKLLIIPISLLLANCTNTQSNTGDSTGSGSVTKDSTAVAAPTQDTMKADTPITSGQRSNSGDKH